MSTIGSRIRERRRELNITQADLAKRMGLTRPALSLLESGDTKTIAGDKLLRAAKALNVSPEWLGGGPEPASKAHHPSLGQLMLSVFEDRNGYGGPAAAQTPDEASVLAVYRKLSEGDRVLALRILEAIALSR